MINKIRLSYFLSKLIIFTFSLGISHFFVVNILEKKLYFSTSLTISFLFFTSLITYLVVFYTNAYFKEYTGYAFMAMGVLKMFVSVLFLLPVISNKDLEKTSDIISFFIPFFMYLVFVTYYSVQLLTKQEDKIS